MSDINNKNERDLFNKIFDILTPEKILSKYINESSINNAFYKNILLTEDRFLSIDDLKNKFNSDTNSNIPKDAIKFNITNFDNSKKCSSLYITKEGNDNVGEFLDKSFKDSTYIDMFFNTIPTVHLAQLMPFLRVRFLYPEKRNGNTSSTKTNLKLLPSTQNFLSVDLGDNKITDLFNDAQIIDFNNTGSLNDLNLNYKSPLTGKYFITDESIYLSPPTISDSLRPFMSLSKVDIKINPTVDYAVSFEEFNLSMTLHDRTKLHKFPYLIGVEYRSDVSAVIEYGWSHPGDPATDVYAYLFNKVLRKTCVCNLTNCSYSFDDVGQVKLEMKLMTKGVGKLFVTKFHSSGQFMSVESKLNELSAAIKRLSSQFGLPSGMRGTILLQSLSNGKIDKLEDDDIKELNKFIQALEKTVKSDKNSTKELNQSIEAYKTFLGSKETKQEVVNTFINNLINEFMKWVETERRNNKYTGPNKDYGDVFLHEIITYFISKQLLDDNQTTEVQTIYYNFGKQTFPGVRNSSIGLFSIFSEDLKKVLLGNKQVEEYTIEQMLGLILRKFLGDPRTPSYGLLKREPNLYSENKKQLDQAEDQTKKKLEDQIKKEKNINAEIKDPKVNFRVENSNGIIRIHVYDQTKRINLSPISKEQQLIKANLDNKVQVKKDIANQIAQAPKNFNELKNFYKEMYPSILYNGSSTSVIKSLQLSNNADPQITSHLIAKRQLENRNSSEFNNKQDSFLNMYTNVVPGKITMESLGFPIAEVHQSFFVDMETGTDIDNLYSVSSVNHSIQPGSFKTNFELINQDNFGSHINVYSELNKIQQIIEGKFYKVDEKEMRENLESSSGVKPNKPGK